MHCVARGACSMHGARCHAPPQHTHTTTTATTPAPPATCAPLHLLHCRAGAHTTAHAAALSRAACARLGRGVCRAGSGIPCSDSRGHAVLSFRRDVRCKCGGQPCSQHPACHLAAPWDPAWHPPACRSTSACQVPTAAVRPSFALTPPASWQGCWPRFSRCLGSLLSGLLQVSNT